MNDLQEKVKQLQEENGKLKMQMATKVKRPYEMNSGGMVKKREVETQAKRRLSLFNGCPDKIVLILLSFNDIKGIQNTRVWQTANVQDCNDIEKRSCKE